MLKILQINLNKSKIALAHLTHYITLNSIDIVCIQELFKDFSPTGTWGFLPNYKYFFYPSSKSFSAILIKSSIVDSFLECELSSEYITTIHCKIGSFECKFVSFYCHPNMPLSDNLKILDSVVKKCKYIPLFLLGDTNCHSPIWFNQFTDARGRLLEDFISLNNLFILNCDSSPTWSVNHKSSVIDLSIVNTLGLRLSFDWKVLEDVSLSDHNYIYFCIDTPSPILNNNVIVYMDWLKFDSLILSECSYLNQITSNLRSSQDIDFSVDSFSGVILSYVDLASTEKICKYKNPSTISWWNSNLSYQKKYVNWLRRRLNKCNVNYYQTLKSHYNSVFKTYKRCIMEAKEAAWNRFCVSGSEDRFGKLFKFITKGKSTFSPLSTIKRDDGSFTNSPLDTAVYLIEKFCSPEPSDNSTHFKLRVRLPTDHLTIDPEFSLLELRRAISKSNFKCSFGVDGIKGIYLKRALSSLEIPFLNICNSALSLGYFPLCWKKGRITVIPKQHSKNNVPSSKFFRPITVLCILSKILERLIYNRLSWLSENNLWLSSQQFGFRPGRSTTDALLEIKKFISNNILSRNFVMVLSFDISSAFDHSWHPPIVNELIKNKCPLNLLRLVESFLTSRSSVIRVGSATAESQIFRGTPQGSILSPLLWNVGFNTIFDVSLFGVYKKIAYADDLMIILSAQTIDTVIANAKKTIFKINKWASDHKLTLNMDKLQSCIFHRTRSFIPSQFFFGQSTIPIKTYIKLLGVFFDAKLNFKYHITQKIQTIKIITNRFLGCAVKEFGSHRAFVNCWYKCLILPILSYASPVWHEVLRFKYINRKLESLQRPWLLRMSGCFHSTSTLDLLAITRNFPIQTHIKSTWTSFFYKQLAFHHPSLAHFSFFLKSFQFPYPPSIEFPLSTAPALAPDIEVFTDGSKTLSGTASAYAFFSSNDPFKAISTKQYTINRESSVFYAEAFALYSAIQAIPSVCSKSSSNVYIFSDNLALICSLQEVKLNLPILLDIYKTLISLKNNKFNISLFWVKSHSDNFGNNFVDQLAKEATVKYFYSAQFHPSQNLKKIIFKSSVKEFSRLYNSSSHRKRILKFFPDISAIFWSEKLLFCNPLAGLILSGHGPIRYQTSKFDSTTSSICRFCNQVPESIDHLIFSCPSRALSRFEVFMDIETLSGKFPTAHSDFIFNKLTWNALLTFLKKFKIY